MGYSPEMWGSQAWHFIHMVALTFPPKEAVTEEVKAKYYNFFESLGHTLPCAFCSRHYKEKFDKNPPPLENSKELFQWTVDIHNSVNRDNGKREFTYEEAYNEVITNSNKKPNSYLLSGIALSVSIVTLICLFGYSMRKR